MNNFLNHKWFLLYSDHTTDQNSDSFITIPNSIAEFFDTEKVLVTWGKRKIQAKIHSIDEETDNLLCSEKIFNELGINVSFPISVLYCRDKKQIVIGPIIGILTEIQTRNEESLFPSIEQFSKELIKFCEKVGVFCFIYSWHELKSRNCIGYKFQDGIWLKTELPMPHFFYNRVHSRKINYSKVFQSFLEHIDENKILFYNKLFLNKKDMYDFLQTAFLQPFLPDGSILTKQNFESFLEKFDVFFAKPLFGSQGRGIVRIRQDANKIIIESSDVLEQTLTFSSVDEAWNYFANQPRIVYFVQQEIQLISIDNRVIDFRVLTHLQPDQNWKVTAVTARVGCVNSFISNLAQGGEKGSAKNLLRTIFGPDYSAYIFQMMKELAIAVSVEIDKHLSDSFIELGIDIAVETSGRLKLIEINSKPSKKEDSPTNPPRPSTKAIGQLAIHKSKIYMEENCSCKP